MDRSPRNPIGTLPRPIRWLRLPHGAVILAESEPIGKADRKGKSTPRMTPAVAKKDEQDTRKTREKHARSGTLAVKRSQGRRCRSI